jgi:hypothetical protein
METTVEMTGRANKYALPVRVCVKALSSVQYDGCICVPPDFDKKSSQPCCPSCLQSSCTRTFPRLSVSMSQSVLMSSRRMSVCSQENYPVTTRRRDDDAPTNPNIEDSETLHMQCYTPADSRLLGFVNLSPREEQVKYNQFVIETRCPLYNSIYLEPTV